MRSDSSKSKREGLAAFCKRHWQILTLLAVAAVLIFTQLGKDYLWADEGDTAVLAQSILKFGVPMAWDGKTFTDFDHGTRVNKDLLMVSHPWVQYYLTAGSFWLFGENPLAARLPFALAGWLTIPLLYGVMRRLLPDRRAALTACLLLTISVQFLLYARQCRNYSLQMSFTCALLWLFLDLSKGRWRWWLFILTGVLFFHSGPSGLAPLAALGLLTLVHPPLASLRKHFWSAAVVMAALTLPWIYWAQTGYKANSSVLTDFSLFFPRMLQHFIEWGSVAPVVGVLLLFLWVWGRQLRETWRQTSSPKWNWTLGRKVAASVFTPEERTFFLLAAMVCLAYAVLIALTQARSVLFYVGIRYATPLIPLTMGVVGLLMVKVAQNSRPRWVVLLLLLAVTKASRITPWCFSHEAVAQYDQKNIVGAHMPSRWYYGFFRTGLYYYAQDLFRPNRGSVAMVSEYLKANAKPDDVVITNYEWEPLYFHTGLPQGLKILPEDPIFLTAWNKHLPPYVFSIDDTRWVVWRPGWNGNNGYPPIEVLYKVFTDNGASLDIVYLTPETRWENRENVHFRRYPGDKYKYPQFKTPLDVAVFKVTWKKDKAVQ